MTKRSRRKFGADFKAKVVLEALEDIKSMVTKWYLQNEKKLTYDV